MRSGILDSDWSAATLSSQIFYVPVFIYWITSSIICLILYSQTVIVRKKNKKMCGSDHPVRVYLYDNDLLMCQICCHNKTRQSLCVKQCKKILLQDTIFPYSPLNMRELKQQRGYFKPICSQGALIFVEFPFPFHLSDPVRLIQVSGQ